MGVNEFPNMNTPPTSHSYHLSGSSPCTSPKHPVSCNEHRLAIRFLHDSIHGSVPWLMYWTHISCISYIGRRILYHPSYQGSPLPIQSLHYGYPGLFHISQKTNLTFASQLFLLQLPLPAMFSPWPAHSPCSGLTLKSISTERATLFYLNISI